MGATTMSKNDSDRWDIATKAVRSGHHRTSEGEQGEPIFTSSSFVFANAAEAAARFAGEAEGNIYSRFTNPTVRTFEERLAAMEGGEACVGTSSGMAAILSTCLALLEQGDHIVSSRDIFGTTRSLFSNYLSKLGIATSFVPLSNLEAWEAAIRPETKLLFLETPSNPLTEVADLSALAGIAKARGCMLVVDNCFCTPILQRPLELGADIVVHSATKYLDGQGRCVGGAVVGDRNRVGEQVFGFLRTAGPTMSPFNAWVFLKGLETLRVRMRAHCENALKVAEWLERQPTVERVFYPGLKNHPQHRLAMAQQSGFGGIVSFELQGERHAAWRLIDTVELCSITANLGDSKTTITHPATTTHGRISAVERAECGITEGLVRVAVGLEEPGDIIADLGRGL